MNEKTIQEVCWRIQIQVLAMQMQDYNLASQDERIIWKTRMLDQLKKINQTAQQFNPPSLPLDLRPPVLDYHAQNVTGNWLDKLTQQLTQVFLSA